MDRIEYREGIIYYGGSRAGTELETVILVLSATGRKTVSETCDLLNQLMQSFDDTNGMRNTDRHKRKDMQL